MELLDTLDAVPAHTAGGTCLTVGVFDGVHRGHQQLIERTVNEAARRGLRSAVLTFATHPLELLAPPYAPPLLTDPDEKAALIARCGVDLCVQIEFTAAFASTPAETFLRDVVAQRFGARVVVCGPDFRFGRGGEGDVEWLRTRGGTLGFETVICPPFVEGGRPVRSSRIRQCLLEGALAEANVLLGRPYTLTGRVVAGDGRGRALGFPTANVEPPSRRLVPADGVYTVRVRCRGALHGGMANIGTRPTFDGLRRTIEAHLFDVDDVLYGETVTIEWIARIRDERRFASAGDLAAQLRVDAAACRAMLGLA